MSFIKSIFGIFKSAFPSQNKQPSYFEKMHTEFKTYLNEEGAHFTDFEEARNYLKKYILKTGMAEQADIILQNTKPSIKVITKASTENEISVINSKLGGQPSLPPDFEWPKYKNHPLNFVAQFNLEELAPYDFDKQLPEKGMLSFFYDTKEFCWGGSIEDAGSWRLYYYPDVSNLSKTPLPEVIDEYFNPCSVKFTVEASLPYQIEDFKNNSDLDEEYCEMLGWVYDDYFPVHRLFGYALSIQNDDMEKDCHLASTIANRKNLSKEEIKANNAMAKEWILLFQVDSDNSANMMWGDVGKLYFWIKKHDLKQLNFDKTWMILQCH